jgi:hypothetical protein
MDGMGAAACAAIALEHLNVEITAAFYGNPPPDVTDRDVLIFDFSYPRAMLLDMHSKAKSLKVFDHHDSAQKDLEGLDFAYFDQSKSGAILAWDYFNIGKMPPLILQYIQDRDLWQWQLPQSREVNESLRMCIACTKDEFDIDIDKLVRLIRGEVESEGQVISRLALGGVGILAVKNQFIDHCVEHSFWLTVPLAEGDVDVLAAFAQNKIGSEVGGALAKLSPSGCGMVITSPGSESGDKFGLSLRGIPNTDIAQRIAKHYGGGGHLCASGAGISFDQFHVLMRTIRSRKVEQLQSDSCDCHS